jgi:hypothetical protein
MNDSDSKLDSLFEQARARRADTSAIEYGFETRLMSRLRDEKQSSSIWAMVSWRMMPFFAACVLGLVVWHAEIIDEADDAAQSAAVGNPTSLESLGSVEL